MFDTMQNAISMAVVCGQQFSVSEILLIREALRMAASRHASFARMIERKKKRPTPADRDHWTKAERMMLLHNRLGKP